MHAVVELQGLRPEHRFRERTSPNIPAPLVSHRAIYSERTAALRGHPGASGFAPGVSF
jgi:hypothetical protein